MMPNRTMSSVSVDRLSDSNTLSVYLKHWDAYPVAKNPWSLTSAVRYSKAINAPGLLNPSLISGIKAIIRADIHLAIHVKQCQCPVPQAMQIVILWASPVTVSTVKTATVASSALTLTTKDRGDLQCALPDRNVRLTIWQSGKPQQQAPQTRRFRARFCRR